jgi:YfiH family protein
LTTDVGVPPDLESYMTLPPVPEPFHWTAQRWGAALRCRALEPIATHLFTTRQLELSSEDDWRQVGEAVGAPVMSLTQVHGGDVVVLRRDSPLSTGVRPRADALVSDDPGVALSVRAADCVPLLLADARTGAVGAVHAGWRGTAAGVTTAAVDAMVREFGTSPADLIAAIGPSIGACCYEVGSELVDAFAAAGHPRHLIDRWFRAPAPRRGSFRTALHVAEGDTLRLDVAGANRDQLILAGVLEQNIHLSGLCTAMHLDVLTSFRMEKENAGRIAGVVRAAGV